MTQIAINARTIADELRVIRKALRRIQAHENHAALKAFEEIKRMAEQAKSVKIDPAYNVILFEQSESA